MPPSFSGHRSVGLREGLKNHALLFLGDTNAGIDYRETNLDLVRAARFHRGAYQHASGGRKFQRVPNQVHQDLTQACGIAGYFLWDVR